MVPAGPRGLKGHRRHPPSSSCAPFTGSLYSYGGSRPQSAVDSYPSTATPNLMLRSLGGHPSSRFRQNLINFGPHFAIASGRSIVPQHST